jgi:hypothetical protein
MEEKLSVCSSYLQEAEEKLIELQSSMDGDIEERAAKISEALTFVRGAQKEFSSNTGESRGFGDTPIEIGAPQRSK